MHKLDGNGTLDYVVGHLGPAGQSGRHDQGGADPLPARGDEVGRHPAEEGLPGVHGAKQSRLDPIQGRPHAGKTQQFGDVHYGGQYANDAD